MAARTPAPHRPADVVNTAGPDPSNLLLKPEEAARVLRLGRTTIFTLVKQRRLKAVKVGSLRRFRMADLQAFVDQLAEEG